MSSYATVTSNSKVAVASHNKDLLPIRLPIHHSSAGRLHSQIVFRDQADKIANISKKPEGGESPRGSQSGSWMIWPGSNTNSMAKNSLVRTNYMASPKYKKARMYNPTTCHGWPSLTLLITSKFKLFDSNLLHIITWIQKQSSQAQPGYRVVPGLSLESQVV